MNDKLIRAFNLSPSNAESGRFIEVDGFSGEVLILSASASSSGRFIDVDDFTDVFDFLDPVDFVSSGWFIPNSLTRSSSSRISAVLILEIGGELSLIFSFSSTLMSNFDIFRDVFGDFGWPGVGLSICCTFIFNYIKFD